MKIFKVFLFERAKIYIQNLWEEKKLFADLALINFELKNSEDLYLIRKIVKTFLKKVFKENKVWLQY